MQTLRRLTDWNSAAPTLITLGTFDGVHRGHQAILKETARRAAALGLTSVAITFANHPRSVLPGREEPPLLTPMEYRLRQFAALGIDVALALTFDLALAAMSAPQFVEQVFVKTLRAQTVVLGFNSKFGQGGRGDYAYLESVCGDYGFGVASVAPVMVGNVAVSSTQIRNHIEAGDLAFAAAMLGRPYSVYANIVAGDGRGNKIGTPTANLDYGRQLLPPPGVYVCDVEMPDGQIRRGVTNIGKRPTFHTDGRLTVEAHIINFTGDLYGKTIEVRLLHCLRGEQRFADAAALHRQIQTDIAAATAYAGDAA